MVTKIANERFALVSQRREPFRDRPVAVRAALSLIGPMNVTRAALPEKRPLS
jgi:hypothetical protein